MIPPKEKEDGETGDEGEGGRVTGYERELGWKNRGINGDGGMRRERERERR